MTESLPLRALSALLLLAASTGCSDLRNCAEDNPNVVEIPNGRRLDDGRIAGVSDKTAITYQSAPDNALDPFPAKTKLRFRHELGVTPLFVKIYLSFDPIGTGTKKDPGGSNAESAGNQALIDCKDAHVIEVRNDTCQDFFIEVVASDAVLTQNGTGGAGDELCGE
ncbi:MAG TPA: hypothetical protein VHB79_26125 [Polyangiaceae bacterium]|nr:hypothetical protein [Polyangiaceae bacterium]